MYLLSIGYKKNLCEIVPIKFHEIFQNCSFASISMTVKYYSHIACVLWKFTSVYSVPKNANETNHVFALDEFVPIIGQYDSLIKQLYGVITQLVALKKIQRKWIKKHENPIKYQTVDFIF